LKGSELFLKDCLFKFSLWNAVAALELVDCPVRHSSSVEKVEV